MGDNEDEPGKETASRSDWFKKPTPVQEPTDPDWHVGKTKQEGPPQKWLMTLATSTPTDKSLKDFVELMSTPIDFSAFIMNGLNISNLTQETLLGPAFRLLKGIRKNYAELNIEQRKSFYAFARGMQSRGDVYLTKRILAVTHVSVMRKYGYRRSDELYKFSDGTLTRLLSSLEDITKNIDMTYLSKRRWSTLEKKRAHFMIKDIIYAVK
ncbi:hypothetical protein Tco_0891751 [Tanacetum coccineum]|uniref:Uncharacterized protein n=1 Tax=Tanacetum coccineum TaxID=301880 RepID=A0ABQ5C5J8_9ASTR